MGAFKLGKMTFGSLFKKPETVLYPLETKPQPKGLKGHIAIDVSACILCGMCERSCTTDCIAVDKQEGIWSINRYQCIQCGYCITVCPKKCLSMDPNYAPASVNIERDIVAVPKQEKPAKAAQQKESNSASTPAAGSSEPPTAEEKPVKTEAKPVEAKPEERDAQIEKLIAMMDPEKAKVVESAFKA